MKISTPAIPKYVLFVLLVLFMTMPVNVFSDDTLPDQSQEISMEEI
ncbi:MAG: hypothetical protein WC836_13100 [Desulfobacula sp.]|jgi:hypothetical protein